MVSAAAASSTPVAATLTPIVAGSGLPERWPWAVTIARSSSAEGYFSVCLNRNRSSWASGSG